MTKTRTRTLVLAGALALTLGLTGCGASSGGGNGAPDSGEDAGPIFMTSDTFTKTLPDGRTVLCIWAKEGYGGGLSCDWDNAK